MTQAQTIDTHDLRINYGKHSGERITRVPASYLRWMVNENAPMADAARAEIERRGTPMPDVELSAHAIDRASLRCRKVWHNTKQSEDEGIHSWLCRMVREGLEAAGGEIGEIHHGGLKLILEPGEEYPVLKTVMPNKEGRAMLGKPERSKPKPGVERKCACGCGRTFRAKPSDIKRGWGLYANKSCKAKAQGAGR